MDTKNADKKLTLMHFLVQTVQEKFPETINFDSELRFIEKAALGRYLLLVVSLVFCVFEASRWQSG